MDKIKTPIGQISIMVDGTEIESESLLLSADDRLFPDILGRYKFVVNVIPDGEKHTISCVLLDMIQCQKSTESGERLECQSFYSKDRYKLSVGLECEAVYFEDGTRASDEYDYDAEYLENGMAYVIDRNTKTRTFVIGVAWIDNVGWDDDENGRDVQTWFAADPTLM